MNYMVISLLLLSILTAIWYSRRHTFAALRFDDVNALEQHVKRRDRILNSPFFADTMSGEAHNSFLKSIEASRCRWRGEDSVFTHISLVNGCPGEYVVSYFEHDPCLLDAFRLAKTDCEKADCRKKLLSELMCSEPAAEEQIVRQGTEFVDSFLSRLNYLEFDPIGECPSYEFTIPVESLDMNAPILSDKSSRKVGFTTMIRERKRIFTLITVSITLAIMTALCIHFSDSFYYPGIAHYRTYLDLFGAFPAAPKNKWPIVFSVGSFSFGTSLALLLTLIVRRGQNPAERWEKSMRTVITYCAFPVLIGGILLIHYTLCDFVGDRWFVLNHMFNTALFSMLKKVYFYLHEIVPFLFCLVSLWCAVSRACLSQRLWKAVSAIAFLVFFACGLFFLILDLWFQKWAILPIILGMTITITVHAICFKKFCNPT